MVAGASGFVGRVLVPRLARVHSVVALAREQDRSIARDGDLPGVEWRTGDLFNLRHAEEALAGAEVAVYLIQSLRPQAHLTQGALGDLDILCADNFGRAAAQSGVRRIVQLGCLLPRSKDGDGAPSSYFESRVEVERTLGSHGVPVTTVRVGLIVGAGGLAFDTLLRAARAPLLIAPRWMRSSSHASSLTDVVALLELALERSDLAGRAYDIGGAAELSHLDMLRLTAEVLGTRPRIAVLPVRAVRLSRLVLRAALAVPATLVRPLVEALREELVATDGQRLRREAGLAAPPLREGIVRAVEDAAVAADAEPEPARTPEPSRCVCSVQRLRVGVGRSAHWVAEEFLRWLPGFFAQALRVTVDEANNARFLLWPLRRPLLILTFAPDRSSPDRQLFFVTGGLLTRESKQGRSRLEFRTMLDGAFVLAAIYDYWPRLPWLIYELTQARVHLFVMRRFAKHVGKGCPASAGAGA